MPDEADIGSDYTEKWLEGQIAEHQYQLSQASADMAMTQYGGVH